jgi:hypothetical protein
MHLYMGMPGHAAFASTDGGVFAYVHPSASVPMAAVGRAQPDNPHVQMNRAGHIVTGIFDAKVEN